MAKCAECGGKVYYLGCDTNVKHGDDFPIKWCNCKGLTKGPQEKVTIQCLDSKSERVSITKTNEGRDLIIKFCNDAVDGYIGIRCGLNEFKKSVASL